MQAPDWSVPGRASTSCRGPRPVPVASTREGRRDSAGSCRWLLRKSLRKHASGEPMFLPPGPKTLLQGALREHTVRRSARSPEGVRAARGVATTCPRCRHLGCAVRGGPSPWPSWPLASSPLRTACSLPCGRVRSPDLRGVDVAAVTRSRFRSTGSRLPPRRSLRRGALRSFSLVHSALSARFFTVSVLRRARSEEPVHRASTPATRSPWPLPPRRCS